MNIKFDFNDILIIPKKKTNISSRYSGVNLPNKLPLFTAPMDTVVDEYNFYNYINAGITVVLPRTVNYNNFILNHKNLELNNIFFSFGFDDLDKSYKNNFNNFHRYANILIDVANGHMQKIVDYCQEIKRLRPDVTIMVGNIANPETYEWYVENNCVDYIRCGIGNGGGCLTSKNSGVGYPSASLIQEIRKIKDEYESKSEYPSFPKFKAPYIVADGGMKEYSDIIKALAIGADFVMIGSIFNKTIESSGSNYLYGVKIHAKLAKYFFSKGFPIKKHFRGMSTKSAQKAMGKTSFKTSEGVVRYRNVEYTLEGWVKNFKHYLRNAMSYSDSRNLNEFIGKANICQITKNAYDRFNK